MEFSYSGLGEWIGFEAVFKLMSSTFLPYRIFLSREEFTRREFMVTVNCDGLLALAQADQRLMLVMERPSQLNGKVLKGIVQ